MDWIQTLTIIGTLSALIIGLHISTGKRFDDVHKRIDDVHNRINDLADDIKAIREDIRLIMNKLIPSNKKEKVTETSGENT